MIDPAEVEQYVFNASDRVKTLVKELGKEGQTEKWTWL